MAFTQDTFAPVGPQSTDAPSVYTYSTSDSLATIETAGYYLDKSNQLDQGDVIITNYSGGFGVFTVLGDTSSVVESVSGDISAALPIIYLNSRQDVIDNGTLSVDEITLDLGNYYIGPSVDLGSDVMVLGGGTIVWGGTATISQITSSSSKPTITVRNGGFALTAIYAEGGLRVNNTGGGAAVRCEGTDVICSIRRLLTSVAGNVLEIDGASVLLDSWTCLNAVNGIVMTGLNNTGPIINNFNAIGLTGKGIYIDGDIVSGALRVNDALIGDASNFPNNAIQGNGIEVASGRTIQGMSFSGDAISNTGNGIKIAGDVDGGLSLDKTNILSFQDDGMDITGSTMSSFIADSVGITATGAGKFGLVGDAGSANITTGSGLVSSSFIDGVGAGGGALSGITKKDAKWSFTNAGPKITDSASIAVFTLDAPATTTFSFQGADGSIASVADNGGGFAQFNIGAHSFANGTPVSVHTSTEYQALGVMANVTATTFDLLNVAYTATDTGDYETGWIKINGATSTGVTNERYTQTASNEMRSDRLKTIPATYTAIISGRKSSGSAQEYQFSVFKDPGDGVFYKVDGSVIVDLTNRDSEIVIRVPTEAESLAKFTVYIRPMDAQIDFIADTFTADIQ